MKSRKIKTITELARYRITDTPYRVALCAPDDIQELADEDKWMESNHPKFLFTRGPAKAAWPYRKKLPRLNCHDFNLVVGLLRCRVVVAKFQICEIVRCFNTGEFFYCNPDGEWMPESNLFDTDVAAIREGDRIIKMFRNWASG